MKTFTLPKSIWESVAIDTDAAKSALRSWFAGMADDLGEPVRANVLTRTRDGATLKIRALFQKPSAEAREAIRTLGRQHYSIRITSPRAQRWA